MFQRIILAIGALVAAYISLRAITAPESVLVNLGLIIDGADGRSEIRGQYGGFFGAVAIAMVLSLIGKLPQKFGLGMLLITVGGVLMGRLLSIVIEGPQVLASYSSSIQAFIIVDIILVALTLLALRTTPSK